MTGTESGAPDTALESARAELRSRLGWPWGSAHFVRHGHDLTEDTIQRYRELKRVMPDGTGLVRRGVWKYDRERESQRIGRGEAIILRVEPHTPEDPNYFAMLAYQAASIELAYEELATGIPSRFFSKFLLGTAGMADVNAISKSLNADGYTIVVLNSGLVDFLYQAAKVIVEAMRPRRTTGQRVRMAFNAEAMQRGLKADPAPIDRLYRTMEAYFFNGYPRATAFENVPEEQHPPLALIVGLAERWIIGHEYGHGVVPSMTGAPADVNKTRAEEYFADTNAMIAAVWSADKFDHVPPQFPIGGAIFALACLELLRRALCLLRSGQEHCANGESDTHPSFRDRATALVNGFKQFFEVAYHADHTFELWFTPKPNVPDKHGFTEGYISDAYQYAEALQIVWAATKERLVQDQQSRRPLHPMWQKTN